jgi:hypothetical protein
LRRTMTVQPSPNNPRKTISMTGSIIQLAENTENNPEQSIGAAILNNGVGGQIAPLICEQPVPSSQHHNNFIQQLQESRIITMSNDQVMAGAHAWNAYNENNAHNSRKSVYTGT